MKEIMGNAFIKYMGTIVVDVIGIWVQLRAR